MASSNLTRVAIITGISGQVGSYLAEILLMKNYRVHGVVRDIHRLGQAAHLKHVVTWHEGSIENPSTVHQWLKSIQPDEYYNLAAISFVPKSLHDPLATFSSTGLAVPIALESIRQSGLPVRFFQAGSSEMFGRVETSPQDEATPFRPMTPYATAKVMAHNAVQNYRHHYGLFACNGILYNHESPRRGPEFVTRKITMAVAKILLGLQSELWLGDLDAKRDWGFAGDFAAAMWQMLQQPTPSDYVIGTGKLTSVREVVKTAFQYAGLDYRNYVRVDPALIRPPETVHRFADISHAQKTLGWNPSTPMEKWLEDMLQQDIELMKHEQKTAIPSQQAA